MSKSQHYSSDLDVSQSWTYQSGETIRLRAVPRRQARHRTEASSEHLRPSQARVLHLAFERPLLIGKPFANRAEDGPVKRQFYRNNKPDQDSSGSDSLEERFIQCPMCHSSTLKLQANPQIEQIKRLQQALILCKEDQQILKKQIEKLQRTSISAIETSFKQKIHTVIQISQKNLREKLWGEIQSLQQKFTILRRNDEQRRAQTRQLQLRNDSLQQQKLIAELKSQKLQEQNFLLKTKIKQLQRSRIMSEEHMNTLDSNSNSPPTQPSTKPNLKNNSEHNPEIQIKDQQ